MLDVGHNYYNLLFSQKKIDGLSYLDLGYELSLAIEPYGLDNPNLPTIAVEIVSRLLSENIHHSEELGDYIAIENINILFEPALKLNIKELFNQQSKDKTLVVKIESSIENNAYYPFPECKDYKLDLSGVNMTQIL